MSQGAEVPFHILRYGCQKLAEGDINALLDPGFLIEEIKAIEKLTLMEVDFLDVKINPHCFAASLRPIRREADSETLQDELIRLRAPVAMMQALFGMTPLQYANRRKLLGLAGAGIGRPAAPPEQEQHAVCYAWREHAELAEPERYLETSRRTGVPLNSVWALVPSWEPSSAPELQPTGSADRGAASASLSQKA